MSIKNLCATAMLLYLLGCGKGLNNDPAAPETPLVSPRIIALSTITGGGTTVTAQFDVAMDVTTVSTSDFTDAYTDVGGAAQTTSINGIGAWSAGNTIVILSTTNFLPATGTFYLSIASGAVTSASGSTNSALVSAHLAY